MTSLESDYNGLKCYYNLNMKNKKNIGKEIEEIKPLNTQIIPIQQLDTIILNNPLYIVVNTYDEEVLAEHPDTESYASAETYYEAINGLRIEIEELYHHLKEIPDNELGRNLLRWKKLLIHFIEPLSKQKKHINNSL